MENVVPYIIIGGQLTGIIVLSIIHYLNFKKKRKEKEIRRITSGDSFTRYMEGLREYAREEAQWRETEFRPIESEIVWSENAGRYMTWDEYNQHFGIEEKKEIDIKPKKEKIRHHFTGLPWE